MASALGVTLHNDGDFSPRMETVSGRTALIQALLRRLSTSPRSLWYARGYGRNLCDFVNQAITTPWAVEQAAQSECEQDERVESCEASAEIDGAKITLRLVITTVDGDSFELVLEVSKVTVEILNINEVE